jgi:hypothetical protein
MMTRPAGPAARAAAATGGGAGAAATGGTAGSSATGGAAGSGGSAGHVCANVSPGGGTNTLNCVDTENNACQKCIETKCCAEFEACWTANPNNPCAYGAPDGSGEIYCMMECAAAAGSVSGCDGACQSSGCATIDPATSALWGCMDTNCVDACKLYGG